MRVRMRWSVVWVSAAGVLAMGADPPPLPVPPSPHAAERLAQTFPTPRLYAVSATLNGRALPGYRMCQGGAAWAKAIGAAAPPTRPRPDPEAALKGCTSKSERAVDGAMHLEMACDKAAGAQRTYRMVSDIAPGMREMRTHSESAADPAEGRAAIVSDRRMTLLGDCPADLKPGEMLMDDGRKVDALAAAAAAAARAGAPK
jgi:hypothetical protein